MTRAASRQKKPENRARVEALRAVVDAAEAYYDESGEKGSDHPAKFLDAHQKLLWAVRHLRAVKGT